ncbi:ABC transporter substrate-binding protein [Defluviitalea phaphyphila]|uniref:ABC transporter substrate-binding protein n=1 Tax=Defluviitalea phaphyphila TaxID=1473580 RepID=UPI0007312877|nr:ABC transporter substrate-binding protein [Defluviitalea phaphyphila]
MRKFLFLFSVLCLLLTSCSSEKNVKKNEETISVIDSAGNEVTVKKSPKKVVSLTSSFGEIWMLSGGTLVGISSDAFEGRDLGISKDEVDIIGTVINPNVEKVLSLQPDLVILSKDISNHMGMTEILDKANIPYYICKVENLEDYLFTLKNFVYITGKEEYYEINGQEVKNKVSALLSKLPSIENSSINALVLRSYSSGVSVKVRDDIVCDILEEIGVNNIAKNNNAILEDLNMEAIIEANPDYIFITTMGSDKEKALSSLNESLMSNPAWNNLKAVKNNNVFILPKDLFHYKPNNKWGDAYEYLLKIIYPEIYETE